MKQRCIAVALWAAASASAQERPIRLEIAPGKVGEVCMPLRSGDTLAWQFKSSAAADFNLHDHVGSTVNMPVRRRAVTRHHAQHRVERTNEWCLMWTAPKEQGITVEGGWHVSKPSSR